MEPLPHDRTKMELILRRLDLQDRIQLEHGKALARIERALLGDPDIGHIGLAETVKINKAAIANYNRKLIFTTGFLTAVFIVKDLIFAHLFFK